VGGPPGDAFEVVYERVTDKVRRNMHAADPVLGEYIRWEQPQHGFWPVFE
jgi:hypothetical protein